MATWTRNPQECEGNYQFDGPGYKTIGVQRQLSPQEIGFIIADLLIFVAEKDGIDFLQVYECTDGRKVWCIDDVSHWTMLLPEEY